MSLQRPFMNAECLQEGHYEGKLFDRESFVCRSRESAEAPADSRMFEPQESILSSSVDEHDVKLYLIDASFYLPRSGHHVA